MTKITKIECRNFKSFADKTEILFGDRYNTIIGPNGAGKSNVVDLICFVLGKSSAKGLRAEKSANLIFNGGKKKNPAKEAHAAIFFDNSEKAFSSIKEKELKVTRIVNHKGNSTYKINDQTVNRREVVDLLATAGIDPDGHNIILQGDIIHFMEMKSEERRGLIEGIAGISIYEEKKQQSMNELQKVDERLNEADIILHEREANLRELKKERDQAIKYKELEENVKRNKATHIYLNIKEKEKKIDEIHSSISEHENSIKKIKEDTNEVNEKIKASEEKIKEINERIENSGEIKQKQVAAEIQESKIDLARVDSRIKVCKNEIERIENGKNELDLNIKDLDGKIEGINSFIKNTKKEVQDLKDKELKINSEITKIKKNSGIADIEEKDSQLKNIEKALDESIVRLQEAINKKENILRNKERNDYELKNLKEKLIEITDLEKKNKEKVEKIKSLKTEFKTLAMDLSKAISENTVYSAQLSNARQSLSQKNEELTKTKYRSNIFQDFTSQDMALKKLIDTNQKGVHGLVRDLATVEGKYKTALSVAAGAKLNSLVVDTDVTAERCIKYLRESKLGVVTFIPLNKIRARVIEDSVKDIKKSEGVVDFASNLISYNKKYDSVFSYVFGNTLIVNDINIARRIGIGRARMVTLQGDLVETSGAMIGGFRRQETMLSFKEKEIDSSLDSLGKETERLGKLISSLEEKKSDNEEKIIRLRERKAIVENQITTLEHESGLKIDSNEIESKIKEISSRSYEKEIKELTKQHLDFEKDINIMKEKRSSLQSQINSAINPKLNQQLELLEKEKISIKEEVSKKEAYVASRHNELMNIHEPEKQKIFGIMESAKSEKEKFKQEIQTLSEKIKSLNSAVRDKESEQKKFYGEYKTLFEKRDKINEQVQGLEKRIIRNEERLKSTEERLNNLSIDRAKIIGEKEGLDHEFKEYKEIQLRRGIAILELAAEIKSFEDMIKRMGNVNLRALEVYERLETEYLQLLEKADKLKAEKQDVLNLIFEIDNQKKDEFMKTFNRIQKNFQDIFNKLSSKGEALLEVENPEDPFSAGVDIKVRIISNKFLDIKSLSGGEKTMAALAFIFAIQEHNPASFYLMDEVDAALDKRNSELLSKLIAKYADNAQYIVISHNDTIITEADKIYGVSMQEGISRIVSLKV